MTPKKITTKEKTITVEESLRKRGDLPEERRNELRTLRDAEGQLVWYRADKIRDTVDEAGAENLMLCYSLIARDVGRSIAAVRSDLLISRLFESAIREEFGALSVSYFRAASMYQRNPRAVLELVAQSAEENDRGEFCTVERAYKFARDLRDLDEGKDPDPPAVSARKTAEKIASDVARLSEISRDIGKETRKRVLEVATAIDELLALFVDLEDEERLKKERSKP